MSYYVIGIGGTGARCVEAFVHMTAAGLLGAQGGPSGDVKVILVDPDTTCGNVIRTIETIQKYNKCRVNNASPNDIIFRNKIDFMMDTVAWSPVQRDIDGNEKMNDVFNYVNLKNNEPELNQLYEAIFTEQERNTTLNMGFRGHPSIGALIMANALKDESEQPWANLINTINADNDARVFIFASVFGGTGASGFPNIARVLKSRITGDVFIGGSLVLPYFNIPIADGDKLKLEMQVKNDEMLLNTQAALKYYDRNKLAGDIFQSIYLVGSNEKEDVKNFALGASTQKNNAHFVELYSALAAMDFFNKPNSELQKMRLEKKFETPMIAREKVDTLEWNDLPSMVGEKAVEKSIKDLMMYLWLYRNRIYPVLSNDVYAKGDEPAWYSHIVASDDLDLHNNSSKLEAQFKPLNTYADQFIEWVMQLHTTTSPKLNLFDTVVCSLTSYERDPDELYFGNRAFTQKDFFDAINEYKENQTTGANALFEAMYEICSNTEYHKGSQGGLFGKIAGIFKK